MTTVDALVCVEPGRLRLEQRPVPRPGPEEALVRPLRVGICGTDYHIFEGTQPFLAYPRVMGHELAVEIVEAPAGSDLPLGEVCVVNPYIACGRCIACRNGKPNCCVRLSVLGVHQDGGMTGLLSVPVGNLVRAPAMTPDQCATVEFLAIGAHAVRRGAVTAGDRVLVVGAGPIGLGTALFARLAGANVILYDRDAERAQAVGLIAGATVLPGGTDPSEAQGEGFDVVFDATGSARAMEKGFDFVAHGGRYVFVGLVSESITFMDPDFHRKEMTLLASRNATSQDFERVLAAIRDGNVAVQRLITHRTRPADAARDISRWASNKAGLIKALVVFE
ncbi:MAG TPA: zinc-binding alcohol dehydrogenase family protein [Amaricoccus sp.]|uniref:zinc-binding alcohol dehydrogenase family protein n=1 Tax=Amaricoccus sp. TaxID=1872485 RepID=UPI002BF48038|nr:zinc-binding alcohol dehydrogenase family protein [Amaricoccus sp.]HMQ92858.1 zinc-binding alcohol dehydrogenase family protein [Amaricoccus sp.]HMR37036.1 zinc-binding alcohol dehydrogenase family protein [Paracoccus sp. (in: a-proteobacteria)]HMR54179.1 zinc-binding alcohol dehydrogenase family protein [Amaricoccus sp.]HMU01193.1 zinc-binding alcohol dehydrogenase family protein [Amaricoccus sp.]